MSTKRTLPRGTAYEERAIALAKRLGIDTPQQPFTDAQWLTLWAGIGKVLLRIEPPEPRTLKTLWADVGMYLAEISEPEFEWGPGRRPGSRNKQLAPADRLTPAGLHKRRQRQKD
ncbi:MAG: hypothetical protein ACLQJ0_15880 [Steroidobacteraceae bacterium]|jgi:hypothetical protein